MIVTNKSQQGSLQRQLCHSQFCLSIFHDDLSNMIVPEGYNSIINHTTSWRPCPSLPDTNPSGSDLETKS